MPGLNHEADGHGWVAVLNDLDPEPLLFQVCHRVLDGAA
jgi:hypothetical protein